MILMPRVLASWKMIDLAFERVGFGQTPPLSRKILLQAVNLALELLIGDDVILDNGDHRVDVLRLLCLRG